MSIRKVFNTPVPSQLCKNVVLFRDGRVMRKHANIDLPEVEESLKPVNVTRKGRYTIAGERTHLAWEQYNLEQHAVKHTEALLDLLSA